MKALRILFGKKPKPRAARLESKSRERPPVEPVFLPLDPEPAIRLCDAGQEPAPAQNTGAAFEAPPEPAAPEPEPGVRDRREPAQSGDTAHKENGRRRKPETVRRISFAGFIKDSIARLGNGKNRPEEAAASHAPEETVRLECHCRPAYTRTRVLSVSREHLKAGRIVAIDEHDPVADQFKLLRTLVFQQTRPRGWNTIQVAGFYSGDGSSLVAANLAVSICKDVRQTSLLVDLNFRNPSIERLLDLQCDIGLKSYFLDNTGIEAIMVNPAIEKLTVLPAGGKIPHAPELMGSPKMQQLVKELKERYSDRYIIFDTPAVSSYPDALVFSEYVDAIILVARAGRTTQDSVKATVELIPREKILGVVLNDSKDPE